MIILLVVNVAAVSATAVDNSTEIYELDNYTESISDDILSAQEETPDYPDLIDTDYEYVYQSNIGSYFKENTLDDKYSGKDLVFCGSFDNVGQLIIDCDDVSIRGFDCNMKNTVFQLTGNGITLKDINFDLTTPVSDNKGAGILVQGNEISLIDLYINYIVPNDVEAYAIFVDGYGSAPMEHFKLINSTVYFEGHNNNLDVYNCALKLTDVYESTIENNTITTSLPLKNIDYTTVGATLDSAYVYTIGIESCDFLSLNNNTIICDVNMRPAVEFPTLNGIMISKSDYVVLSNNSLFMTDFVTYPGTENYLYGIDIHNLNNLLIVNNSISMITTGGKLALGTAYPIQISGPIEGVEIIENDLYSFSNGPNIGIYSQNYYGATYLSIKNNRINVTGLAGTHDWALVTGIESQDTFAEIMDNQIEVHSVADVGINDNLYAISYRQSTAGPHTYDIENNVAITDGYYSVYLLSSSYSTIADNTLISFNNNVNNGDDGYAEGFRQHYYDESYNNRVIRALDYYANDNFLDNGNIINIGYSSNPNIVNTGSLVPQTTDARFNNNPLLPAVSTNTGINQGSSDDSTGYIDDGSTQGVISQDLQTSDINGDETESSDDVVSDINVYASSDGRLNSSNVNGDGNAISNSSSASPALSNSDPLGGSEGGASSQAQSVSKKAYEIEEAVEKSEFIPSIIFVIAALILLIIGYRRKNNNIN